MAVELDTQFDDNSLTKCAHPEALPKREERLEHGQGKQEEHNGMQCRDISRHDAIDNGTYERGIGEIESTGHKGRPHQQSQLPPIGPCEAKQTQQRLPRGFDFR